jgi:hypothetical protein
MQLSYISYLPPDHISQTSKQAEDYYLLGYNAVASVEKQTSACHLLSRWIIAPLIIQP